ncbi:hypothetical protein, partial [Candidatus Venteria ishoeyi]|uniref:hypothetical protein n=1 Tax=Candidatus Venteria ishoeyi TaxID=1899563 RepID=UPI000CDEC2CC
MSWVHFHRLAEAELYDAAHYYEKQATGLGDTFLDNVWRGIEQISTNPSASPLVSANVCQKVLQRFPFNLLYRIEKVVEEFSSLRSCTNN